MNVPDHVCAAFGASTPGSRLGAAWDHGLRAGNIVLSRVLHPEIAAWSAKARERLTSEGVRVVRPVRSSDGRFVVGGWRASVYATGSPTTRVDETVVAALRLSDALVDVPMVEMPESVFSLADRSAWSSDFHGLIRPLTQNNQVGHADMLATTIYSGDQVPAVTDIVPVFRPHGYSAALVIIDGLLTGAVDDGIIRRFSHLPDIDQLLLRGFLYRRAIAEQRGQTTEPHFERVERLLLTHLSATM